MARRPPRLDLYVILDGRLGGGRDVVEQARAAVAGGADAIQLREKGQETGELVELARRVGRVVREGGALFIVNDRVDVALAADADGVHLGQDDMRVDDARRLLGPDRIVGASAGNEREWVAVAGRGADYVGVGPVYPTASKPDAGAAIGPAGIAAMRARADIPIVAIGGIAAENLAPVIAAGADGVATISAVVSQPDIAAAARRIKYAIDEARRARP